MILWIVVVVFDVSVHITVVVGIVHFVTCIVFAITFVALRIIAVFNVFCCFRCKLVLSNKVGWNTELHRNYDVFLSSIFRFGFRIYFRVHVRVFFEYFIQEIWGSNNNLH